MTFNRTILELKLEWQQLKMRTTKSFNRTILELKQFKTEEEMMNFCDF